MNVKPLWTRHLRREVQFILDAGVLTAAFAVAYLLRFDFVVPEPYRRNALLQLPLVLLIEFAVIILLGIYNFVWRYIGMAEIWTFLRVGIYSAVPLLVIRVGGPDAFAQWRVPGSVILMNSLFACGGLLALRVLRRALYERYERSRRRSLAGPDRQLPVLLVGAGQAGVMAVREIRGRGDLDLDLVGFVDDDPLKLGSVINGLKVLGTTRDLPELVREHAIDHVVITIANAEAETIRNIVRICDRIGTRMRIIPGFFEIIQGKVSITRFRDVEIEDLLGREAVRLDEAEVRRFVTGKRVLLTGAGGSIGSELARQLARFQPSSLLLVERAEGALFEIDRELRDLWPMLELRALVADAGAEGRMRGIFERHAPHVVLHAAAHKHVPMMELNPAEALTNNVLATEMLGRLAAEAGVEAFVLISTDKAVRPSSVMGASKRLAELVAQDLDRRFPRTRFVAVRFGNVLGSTGSVVPIFRQQIARGGPVTVTHPEATRYFMTIPEAAQLVLEAGALGRGAEIMILDMGEPIKILDLAQDMIRLSGYKPFEEIGIDFTGLRPGEKLVEELELQGEEIDRTRHPKIFVGRLTPYDDAEIERSLARARELALTGSAAEIREFFSQLLPESLLTTEPPPAPPELPAPDVIH